MWLAGDLSRHLETFLRQEEAQCAADDEENSREQQQSVGLDDEDDNEERDESTPAEGCRADLPRLKRLCEQLLHTRACSAIPLVPLEQLQRLLKALDAHLLRGRDKVLHRSEQVLMAMILTAQQYHEEAAQSILGRAAFMSAWHFLSSTWAAA